MNKLGEKSLKTLEYYEILEKLAGQAASQAAKEKCRALRPLDDHEQAELWLQQTTDAKDLMVRQGSPAFGGVRDVGEALSRAERGGGLDQPDVDLVERVGEQQEGEREVVQRQADRDRHRPVGQPVRRFQPQVGQKALGPADARRLDRARRSQGR